MLWTREDRESFARKRARGGIALTLLFLGFALLHFLAAKMEEPPPDPTLQVFDA